MTHLSEVFDAQKLQTVLQRIGDLADRGCPLCGCTTWNLTSINVFRLVSNPPGIISGGAVNVPLLAIECDECAHQMFFNAIALGLVKRDKA